MRTLNFIVTSQTIKRDPNCDFSGLVPGSEEYLQARFSFSPEWDGCIKVAGFYSMMGREYEPQVLKGGTTCLIPAEALKKKSFKIQIIGKKGTSKLTTNKVVVKQDGGKS